MSIYSEYRTGCIDEDEFRTASYQEEMRDRAAYEAQFDPIYNWKTNMVIKAQTALENICDHCTDHDAPEDACDECPIRMGIDFLNDKG